MGVFTSFKEAIFGKDKHEAAAAPRAPASPTSHAPAVAPHRSATAAPQTPSAQNRASPSPTQPAAMHEVDIEAKLDGMAGADKLNWRSSIVDLMKLIGIDASYENRKELAEEMGRSDYSGSAEDNIWLHKRVMSELAKSGGRVPASLRD